MRKLFIGIAAFLLIFTDTKTVNAQSNDTVIFTPLGSFNFSWTYSGYTPLIDRLGRPYVYLAAKELGLVTFDISNTINPAPVDTIPASSLGGLKATGITQDSIYLFISLGDFQGAGQSAGLAIYDISNPVSPLLLDRWDSSAFNKGTSSVVRSGNYVFLSAMEKGILILDISDRHNIKFISQIIPDISFGNHNYTYHARGLFISGDTLLVADDNGGLRVIDVTDKQKPVEIGKYINNTIDSVGAAYYNHIYRIGNYAFCAMDYCGFETVDISNPATIINVAWLNPWNCTNQPPPFGSWNGSDGHCNEIAYDSSHNILFISGGDSQILAFDPRNPSQPRIMGTWGQSNDSIGSWGVDVFGNLVALANIHTLGFPFVSTVGGLQLLDWQLTTVTGVKENSLPGETQLLAFPNPFSSETIINTNHSFHNANLVVKNIFGQTVKRLNKISGQSVVIHRDSLPGGLYIVHLTQDNLLIASAKLLIID